MKLEENKELCMYDVDNCIHRLKSYSTAAVINR